MNLAGPAPRTGPALPTGDAVVVVRGSVSDN